MKVASHQIPGMMKAGLARFIKAQKGQRLDKRSLTAGYYAAAAVFAAATDQEGPMVATFVNWGTDAIDRKGGKS